MEVAARGLAEIASEHELVVTDGNGPLLELALRNALPERDLVTLLTQVVVAADDPAFDRTAEPVGPGGRRLAPSPEPRAIVELRSLRTLIEAGTLVICAGGGGIPVAVGGDGTMRAVEAVLDGDLTASLLARRLDADLLVMLTDAGTVHLGPGQDRESTPGGITPAELRRHGLGAGPMGPKVEAACRFVEATGRQAVIGDLDDGVEIVRGRAGTAIRAPG